MTIIPDKITRRFIDKIPAKAIRASSYERISKSVEPRASVLFILSLKSSLGIANYNTNFNQYGPFEKNENHFSGKYLQ